MDDTPTGREAVVIWAVIFSVVFLVILGCISGCNHLDAPRRQAYILQFQEDLVSLGVCDIETRNTLIDSNATIRKWQLYNKIWYFAWAVPNSWDSLHTVKADNKRCYQSTSLQDINVQGAGALVITKGSK